MNQSRLHEPARGEVVLSFPARPDMALAGYRGERTSLIDLPMYHWQTPGKFRRVPIRKNRLLRRGQPHPMSRQMAQENRPYRSKVSFRPTF